MPRALFLTCLSHIKEFPGVFVDDQIFLDAFDDHGWDVRLHPWNGQALDWSRFDIAILRTAWDYYKKPEAFLKTLQEIAGSGCQLWNPPSLVAWNTEKSYLRDLRDQGIPIPETLWCKREAFDPSMSPFDRFHCQQVVIKPTISVGAFDTLLLGPEQWKPQQLEKLYRGRNIMVQPCLSGVREVGELSMVFFARTFSHGILKRPKAGDFRVQSFHGGQEQLVTVSADALKAAKKVIDSIEGPLLYARVDMVEQDGQWLLMELELIEPQLFLPMTDFDSLMRHEILPFLAAQNPKRENKPAC